ncbi:hypothetical protein [Streptomyces hundungensis]|uniref:hypothetical protein n=1 Tax=Streptomyces hundungensis TaxID=1077946 RepID=UPI0033E4874C
MAEREYADILTTAVVAAGATGPLVLVPMADMTVLAGIWTGMFAAAAKRSGHELDAGFFAKVPTAVLVGGGLYKVGSKLLQRFVMAAAATTGIGTGPVMGANGILNALATLRAGRVFIELCEDEEFDPRDLGRLIPLIQEAVKPWPTVVEIKVVVRFFRLN